MRKAQADDFSSAVHSTADIRMVERDHESAFCARHDQTRPASVARSSPLRAALEMTFQSFERCTRPAACKAPARQVIVFNVLKLAQDGFARIIAFAATGFL